MPSCIPVTICSSPAGLSSANAHSCRRSPPSPRGCRRSGSAPRRSRRATSRSGRSLSSCVHYLHVSWHHDQNVSGRAAAERPPRHPPESRRRISDDHVRRCPLMHDNEVPAAEPPTDMGNRGQRAGLDRVVGRLDPAGTETEAFSRPGQCQQIYAMPVEWDLVPHVHVDRITVTSRDGCQRSTPAVIALALTDDRKLCRGPAEPQNLPPMPMCLRPMTT